MDTPYILKHVFNAPVKRVWQALTDTDQMKVWFFPALTKFRPVAGFVFEFTPDGSMYAKEWQVTAVEDGKKLSFTWAYKNFSGMSEVTFELFEEGNKTMLQVTHTGIDSFPDDPHFARQRFVDGWTRIIGTDLKNFVEKRDSRIVITNK